jgi:hypothetical protein
VKPLLGKAEHTLIAAFENEVAVLGKILQDTVNFPFVAGTVTGDIAIAQLAE